jgi:hypothetical protein
MSISSYDASVLASQACRLRERLSGSPARPGFQRLLSRVESEETAILSSGGASSSRLHGAANNLAAVEWELDVYDWCPQPEELSRTVKPPGCCSVAIDVVGARGHWWLEAKGSLPFGLGSTAWVDLQQQLGRLTKSADKSFCGAQRPKVLVVFKHACPDEIRRALVALGVSPVSPAAEDGKLPDPASVAAEVSPTSPTPVLRPPRALLDVSSLLCLLSSSCRLPASDPQLRAWAGSNEHWARSLDEEAEAPLLRRLGPLLRHHGPPWLVREADRERCDALVTMAGGEAERARWAALRPLLLIADKASAAATTMPAHDEEEEAAGRAAAAGDLALAELHTSLSSMKDSHRQLMLDAAKAKALLYTANARLVRRIPEHVHLPTYVHPARWLVGDACGLLSEPERSQLEVDAASALVPP